MRLIYVDEAGTSPAEPVRVVASVIVEADQQLALLSGVMERLFDERVPAALRENFIFHGKEVFNGGKSINRDSWAFEDRLDFFKEFVCLPFVHDVPIGLGITFRGLYSDMEPLVLNGPGQLKLSSTDFEHAMAFSKCCERSDQFLRKYLNGREKGIVIAEDVADKRILLRRAGLTHKVRPMQMLSEHQAQTRVQKQLNRPPEPYTWEIKHLVDVPHFVDKHSAPMLQLADACAFSFRRFLSRQAHGADLCFAMLGPYAGNEFTNDPVWFTGGSAGLFNTDNYMSDEQRAEREQTGLILALSEAMKTN